MDLAAIWLRGLGVACVRGQESEDCCTLQGRLCILLEEKEESCVTFTDLMNQEPNAGSSSHTLKVIVAVV